MRVQEIPDVRVHGILDVRVHGIPDVRVHRTSGLMLQGLRVLN